MADCLLVANCLFTELGHRKHRFFRSAGEGTLGATPFDLFALIFFGVSRAQLDILLAGARGFDVLTNVLRRRAVVRFHAALLLGNTANCPLPRARLLAFSVFLCFRYADLLVTTLRICNPFTLLPCACLGSFNGQTNLFGALVRLMTGLTLHCTPRARCCHRHILTR